MPSGRNQAVELLITTALPWRAPAPQGCIDLQYSRHSEEQSLEYHRTEGRGGTFEVSPQVAAQRELTP